MGGHGSAVSVMLALGNAELEAAATPIDDDAKQLAHFWYLPGDFTRAVAAVDALSMSGEPILNGVARLALTYQVGAGEEMFRLACERQVITATGNDWAEISPARRKAWELFATVSNRVYSVLEGAAAEGLTVTKALTIGHLAETIFDEDKEGDEDPEFLAAQAIAAGLKVRTDPAEAVADMFVTGTGVLSITAPPAADLPPEDPPTIQGGDQVARYLEDGTEERGEVLEVFQTGSYRVLVDGKKVIWKPSDFPVHLVTDAF